MHVILGALLVLTLLGLAAPLSPALCGQEEPISEERFNALELMILELQDEVEKLKDQEGEETSRFDRLIFGGYGEMHANFTEGSSGDQFDIHRLVLYVGYRFTDWIQFFSEIEIEHAFVSSDSGGELSIEQAFVEFLLDDHVNVRFGRLLIPMGITNMKHEPVAFNGVERPFFDKYILPTTWYSDGLGVFGSISDSLKYQAYLVAGLDGSQFDALDGIRPGRIKERPSLNEPAVTGRLDYFPFIHGGPDQLLRLGVSAYAGGLDNGNKGKNPGIDGDIKIFSADFEYTVSRFDFRGAYALEEIRGAEEIGNGTAEKIQGWMLESAVHVLPESWQTGKLAAADAAVFLRWDVYNTQYKMPDGVDADPAGDRQALTAGLTFFPASTITIKADYQWRWDEAPGHPGNLFNIGLGFLY